MTAALLITLFLFAACAALRRITPANRTDRRPRRMGRPPKEKPPRSTRKRGKRPTVTWRRRGAGQFESKRD